MGGRLPPCYYLNALDLFKKSDQAYMYYRESNLLLSKLLREEASARHAVVLRHIGPTDNRTLRITVPGFSGTAPRESNGKIEEIIL